MPIIAHFINNALAVLIMYSAFANKLNTDISEIEKTDINFLQASISFVVVMLFIYLFKKINSREEI